MDTKKSAPNNQEFKEFRLGKKDVFLFSVGIIILIGVIHLVGGREIFSKLRMLSLPIILLVFLFDLLIEGGWALKWKIIVDKFKPVPFRKIFQIQAGCLLINNLTPGPSVGSIKC